VEQRGRERRWGKRIKEERRVMSGSHTWVVWIDERYKGRQMREVVV
jgi:hypothetical protein